MIRKELVQEMLDWLHENDFRKIIRAQKHIFTISDDRGQKKNFIVQESEKRVRYNSEDLNFFFDAFLETVMEAIKRGEEVKIQGFGSFTLYYKKPYTTKNPRTGGWSSYGDEYKLKFTPAKRLRLGAKVYSLSVKEGKEAKSFIPEPDLEDDYDAD